MIALDPKTRNRLTEALRRNVDDGFAVLMGRDTSFAGTVDLAEDNDGPLVLDAIRSVAVHY